MKGNKPALEHEGYAGASKTHVSGFESQWSHKT